MGISINSLKHYIFKILFVAIGEQIAAYRHELDCFAVPESETIVSLVFFKDWLEWTNRLSTLFTDRFCATETPYDGVYVKRGNNSFIHYKEGYKLTYNFVRSNFILNKRFKRIQFILSSLKHC